MKETGARTSEYRDSARARAFLALLGCTHLASIAVLAGCGGGAAGTAAEYEPPTTMRAQMAGSVLAGNAALVFVDALERKSRRRVARDVFEYDFELTVKNDGPTQDEIFVQLTGVGAGTTIVAGSMDAGAVAAGSTKTPSGWITVRHDRTQPFQPLQLTWKIDATAGHFAGTVATGQAAFGGEVTVRDGTGSSACAQTRILTESAGNYKCNVLADSTAPYIMLWTDVYRARRPMVSAATGTPGTGNSLVVNITPLTSAIVGQAAPNRDPAELWADPSLLDAGTLATVTGNVLIQLGPTMQALNLPSDYDPFSRPLVAGTTSAEPDGAARLLDEVGWTDRDGDGVRELYTIDNPQGAVPMADATTANPPVLPAPSDGTDEAAERVRLYAQALEICLAQWPRALITDSGIPSTLGGPKVVDVVDDCKGLSSPDFLDNGYEWGQKNFGLLTDSGMTGARISYQILRFIEGATPSERRAVARFNYLGRSEERKVSIEYLQSLLPASTAWGAGGNQMAVDLDIRPVHRRVEQLAPNPGIPPYASASASTFLSGIQFLVNGNGPGSEGLRAVLINGPGVPSSGLVMVRVVNSPALFTIGREDGLTDPAFTGPAADVGTVYYLQRTAGIEGAAATTAAANPPLVYFANGENYGLPQGSDPPIPWSQLKQQPNLTIRYFYASETSPRKVDESRMLSRVLKATDMYTRARRSLDNESRRYFDPNDVRAGAQTSMTLSFNPEPFAEPIDYGVFSAFGGGLSTSATVKFDHATGAFNISASSGSVIPPLLPGSSSGRKLLHAITGWDGDYRDETFVFNR